MLITVLTHIGHLTISPTFLVGKADTNSERMDGESVRLNALQT